MNRRALTLVAGLALLVVGGFPARSLPAGTLPGEEANPAEDARTSEQALVEEILRLRQALGASLFTAQAEESPTNSEQAPEDRYEQMETLRREANEFLRFLLAQRPEVLAEVGRLLSAVREGEEGGDGAEAMVGSEAKESGQGARLPASPTAEPEEAATLAEERADVPPSPVPRPAAPQTEPACAEFRIFDTNEDGVVSGLDRYWRYFRLWRDDGDGAIEETELSGLYDAGVREVTITLGTYRTVDGVAGDVLGGGAIRLDLLGKEGGLATLVIDADRLAHGLELELQDGSGLTLSGLQVLTSEMLIAAADGVVAPLSCARTPTQN